MRLVERVKVVKYIIPSFSVEFIPILLLVVTIRLTM